MVTSLFNVGGKENKDYRRELFKYDMTLTAQELYQRGTALVCVGRYAEDIEWFNRALERDPRYKEVLVALAAAVDRLGLFREAVLSSDQAIEIDEQNPDAWFVKGLALFRLSEYTKSGRLFPDTGRDGSFPCRGMVHERELSLPARRVY
jgi:tetratricopeptide (TPR) repeat protein